MAAYRRDDLKTHLPADCLYTGISSGPNTRQQVWENFTFTFCNNVTLPFHAYGAVAMKIETEAL